MRWGTSWEETSALDIALVMALVVAAICNYAYGLICNEVYGPVLCLQFGYTTVYNFYAFPDKTRLRLSQILVLPPYQRQGVGRQMLEAVYKLAISRGALDVAVLI